MQSKQTKTAPVKSNIVSEAVSDDDLITIIDSEIMTNSLIGHHTDSFDSFMSTGINQIVTQLFIVEKTFQPERTKTPEDNEIEMINFTVHFNDIKNTKPTTRMSISGKQDIMLPNMARKNNHNYSSQLFIDATIKATAYLKDGGEPRVRTEEVKNFSIASMPVMMGSKSCHTAELPRKALESIEEDPNDHGGYFVIGGTEWVISMIETRLFNHPHVFRNVGHEKENARLEYISKPGDAYENSSELIMRYVTNGNIYMTFTSNPYLKVLNIPFYIIFRLLGMTTDKEIVDNIVYGYSTPENKDVVSDHMLQVMKRAFAAPDPEFGDASLITDQAKLLDYFSRRTSILSQTKIVTGSGDENLVKWLNANVLKLLDKHLFPHIGLAADTRHKKLRFLGHLIHKLLLVETQIVASTDRDSLKNKRINAAGRAYAKAFKTQFNLAIVQTVKKHMTKYFKSMPFSQVPLAQAFKAAIHGPDLEKALIQAIVTGNKELTVRSRQIPNRLASEMLHRKNNLNVLSTLRVIRTPSTSASKQDQRADEMRRVHPSYLGYICPIQSADTGEQVGMVKQLAFGASLLEATSSELLKDILLQDPEIIPLDKLFPDQIHKYNPAKIMVNGDWIGCCMNAPKILHRYKESRRGYRQETPGVDFGKFKFVGNKNSTSGIDPMTTIHWDTDANEINFWVDAGRMIRPLLVVRNNGTLDPVGQTFLGTYDPIADQGFTQDILVTKQHITDMNMLKLSVRDLHEAGIIDYISPEEAENCYIAESLTVLRANQHNSLQQYTHCEIPPALFGLPALTCPFAQHNQPPRITFQTNQVKQTCSWYTLNWPHRIDKHAFMQYYCDTPLVKTLANKYVYPVGRNATVALHSFTGFGQEDGLIINKSAAERGDFKCMASNFIKTELEKDEKFGNPDEANTIIDRRHANYSKISGGFVKPGTVLNNGDVIIGKLIELPKPEGHRSFRDNSVVYPYDEQAVVDMVIRARNQADEEFCKVKFSSSRTPDIGNKYSSRAGQKSMSGLALRQWDMPYTSHGISPSLIMNPHAMPTRMTIAQLIEGVVAKCAAWRGCFEDATIFRAVDLNAVGDQLEEYGFNRFGTEQCYDGRTGEPIDGGIFLTPTYYQLLQKFVIDEVYSVSIGPTDILTRQPIEGRSNNGGLRLGEMELAAIIAHGAGHFIMEKFRDDSDGFDIYVCRTCQKPLVVNEEEGIVICKSCQAAGTNPDPVKIRSSWASKLFFQELESCNVGVHFGIAPFEYE